MTHKQATPSAVLATILLVNILLPSPAFGFGMKKGGGGGGGGSSVAEILAAGLITGLLMDNRPMGGPMMRAFSNPFIGGFSMMAPRHPMHDMMRAPMMGHYMMPTVHRPRYLMNHAQASHQALMTQASHQALMTQANHQALAARLNQEIRALEAQESMLEAHLARYQHQGSESSLSELMTEEDALPAAALLLETADFMDQSRSMNNPMPHPMHHPMHHPDMLEAAASETESRYLLPRIVRHFVQRLMRRGENH